MSISYNNNHYQMDMVLATPPQKNLLDIETVTASLVWCNWNPIIYKEVTKMNNNSIVDLFDNYIEGI